MSKILVTPHPLVNTAGRFREILENAGLSLIFAPARQSLAENAQMVVENPEITGILASTEPLTRAALAASKLRVVARMGVGFDSIDIPAATELDIVVTTTPGTLEESVAEHAIALMLAVGRDLLARDRHVRQGTWPRKATPRLAGQTLGLVGLGRIGRTVVGRAQGLGMKVIAHDPFPDKAFVAQNDMRLCSLEGLLAEADVVSLHLPSTAETANLINAEALGRMKKGAILINTARGAMVDEEALAAALQSGHLRGAGLDVFKTEPLPTDSPLLGFDNVVLCEHMGGLDEESQEAMANLAAQCLADLYQGRWPEQCVVNRDIQAPWKW